MWELIAKVFPPHLIAGVVLWGLVCFLWLQPLIEERMAIITYIPQCEAGDLPSASPAKSPQGPMMEGSAISVSPPDELPLSVRIITELKGLLDTSSMQTYASRYGAAEGNSCSCAVAVAFDSTFWRNLVHVMSLRTYTPSAIAHFDERVAQAKASGICGRRG